MAVMRSILAKLSCFICLLMVSCERPDIYLRRIDDEDLLIHGDAASARYIEAEACTLISVTAGQEHYPVDGSVAMQFILRTGHPTTGCSVDPGNDCDAVLFLLFGVGQFLSQAEWGSVSLERLKEGAAGTVQNLSGRLRFQHQQSGREWELDLRQVRLDPPRRLDSATLELDGLATWAPELLAAWALECGFEDLVAARLGRFPRRADEGPLE